MKKVFLAMAALAVIGLSGCQNDNLADNGNGSVPSGKKTSLGLTFNMPSAAGTRAATGQGIDGTTEESTVNTVDVFVFEPNGLQAEVGGHTSLALADFTPSGTTYTLKRDSYIETLSGAKRVYVGINIPATALATFTATSTEANMQALVENVAAMCDATATGAGFTMFSQTVATPTLLPDATPDNNADPYTGIEDTQDNIVKAKVERVVAKLITSSKEAIYTKTWTGESASNLELAYSIKDFRVFQHNVKSYIAPNFWTVGGIAKTYPGLDTTPLVGATDAFLDFNVDADATAASITIPHPADAALPNEKGFYIGENYPVQDKVALAKNGNSTYAMVATRLVVDKAANIPVINDTDEDGTVEIGEGTIDTDGDGVAEPLEGAIVWEDVTAYGGTDATDATSTDIYVVTVKGKSFVTNDLTKASAIANAYAITTAPITSPGEGILIYEKGYVHFQVYLNKEDINDYAIARNQFVHVLVNDIVSADFLFPGYPGKEGEPEKPTDPTVDPVDGAPAWLDVDIEVLPWNYRANETILQ